MKRNTIVAIVVIATTTLSLKATDTFPSFSEYGFTIKIPTNTVGCQVNTNTVVGTNIAYSLVGQIFTNPSEGHIQTRAEGFSGTTDKITPWKTITEMLAVSQQGAVSNVLSALYTPSSKAYIDSIYNDPIVLSNYQAFSASITNMQVLLGYEGSGGFITITSIRTTDSPVADVLPLYLVKTNNIYLLSSFDTSNAVEANIGVFLNGNSFTNLFR